jgi:RimJ/RimL family protein N-acetyltransferase
MNVLIMIYLKKAQLDDRKKAYNWLYHSDFSPFLNSLLKETSKDIPTLEDFQEDYEEFYFDNSTQNGRAYLIILENKDLTLEIGFISCTSIHLKKDIAELDIWLKSSEYTGKGFGTKAVRILSQKLQDKNFNILFMRPCRKNIRAISSYKKAGYKKTTFKPEYFKKEYLNELGPGDCIDDDDVFMVLEKK